SDNLKGVLQQFVSRPLPNCRIRELVLPIGSGKVVGLAGVRRSGKTFLFFHTIRRLSAQGIERSRLIYLNFEDDRLQPLRAEDLDLVLRCHRELFPETIGQRCYLFLDEVQNVPGWERWVRRLYDTEDVEVFVTGSSSQLLTRDLSTALRGRSLTLEVFPLSFAEVLEFRGIVWQRSHPDSESVVRGALEQYLRWGGFAEVVLAEEALRPLILGEYASLLLYRDVVERYGVRNEALIRELLRFAFRNTASLVNVSKLHRDFASLGLSASKNTLHEYLGYLEDSFLIFLLPKQERSLRKQAHNPKKLHVIDPGLVAAFQGHPDRDIGRKLETAVFLHLRRQGRTLCYYANGGEVDLCDEDGTAFWNTCWSLTDADTAGREQRSMVLGQSRSTPSTGVLLYHEFASALRSALPEAQPAWRWLLEQKKETTGPD
ncbi:MAG: ATP-binding protein, partial [Acidobacteriota bacterium]